MMKALMVTGSRNWDRNVEDDYRLIARGMSIEIKNLVDEGVKEIIIRQGAAKGADAMVVEFINKIERSLGERGIRVKLVGYPPDFSKYGSPAAYHVRNQRMVDDGAVRCVAFLKPGEPNRGTLNTMSRARKAGIDVVVYGATDLDRQPV